ncbi:hypothetical protein SLE2022_104320 [Rubroshorea leprosula]
MTRKERKGKSKFREKRKWIISSNGYKLWRWHGVSCYYWVLCVAASAPSQANLATLAETVPVVALATVAVMPAFDAASFILCI